MPEILSKEELQELSNIKGEIRGVSLQDDGKFVLSQVGQEGLKRLEEEMAILGYPIKYGEIKPMDFYPLSLDVANVIVMQRLFNFSDEKFQELGSFLAKTSLILRLFMKYFVSLKRMAKEAPGIWKKNYTAGDLKITGLDEINKNLTLRVENFKLHPIYCQILIGYFSSVIQMIARNKPTCQEAKCMFSGDPYHEFYFRW